jgi:hypothetical protein
MTSSAPLGAGIKISSDQLNFIIDRIYRIVWILSFGRSPAWPAIAAQSCDGGKKATKHQSPPANKNGNYQYKFK